MLIILFCSGSPAALVSRRALPQAAHTTIAYATPKAICNGRQTPWDHQRDGK